MSEKKTYLFPNENSNTKGPEKIEFSDKDFKDLESLAGLQSTQAEVLFFFRHKSRGGSLDDKTLARIIRDRYGLNGYSEFFKVYRNSGHISVRRQIYQKIQAGYWPAIEKYADYHLGMKTKDNQVAEIKISIDSEDDDL